MIGKSGDYLSGNNTYESINKYDTLRGLGIFTYFDVDEFIDIIEHYTENGQPEIAHEACQWGLKIHPGAIELKFKNAQLYINQGDVINSQYWLKQASELATNNYEYIYTQGVIEIIKDNIETANNLFNKALKYCPTDEFEDLILQIGELLESYEYFSLAIKFYRKGNRKFNQNTDFIFKLAFCFDRFYHYTEAINFYEQYIEINPFSENVWFNLGILYNKAENYTKAIECYEFAYALDNNMGDAVFNMANALANNDQNIEAIQLYNQYIYEYGQSEGVLYYIGECYLQLKEPEKAMSYFDEIININPQFADGWYGKALVYSENNNFIDAEEYLNKTIETDPEHLDAIFELGSIYSKTKQWQKAVDKFNLLITKNKFDIEGWLCLAKAYYSFNDAFNALNTISRALEIMPTDAGLMYAQAGYLLAAGFTESGISFFSKAYEVYPEKANEITKTFEYADKIDEIKEFITKDKPTTII